MELQTLRLEPVPAPATPDFRRLRRTEYSRLDASGHAYLDYTGAGIHAASQIEAQQYRLLHDVLGNPHSENPAAADATARMLRARRRVLEYVHADPEVYDVVFTANASAALRLVGESFPFAAGSRYVLTADNHNSVNGIRCFADRAGADVRYVPLDDTLAPVDPEPQLAGATRRQPHLFAFPAQSNFSGVRYPLEWIARASALGYHVLLDAAAFAPTAELRLDDVQPDFVCLSFYKMFGFPTGIGALIARRSALAVLERPWFAGGTVNWVSTQYAGHALVGTGEAFEDGTPNFLAVDAVCDGLAFLERLGPQRIEQHVRGMTTSLINGLLSLRHPDHQPLVEIYGPRTASGRGGTVAFNVRDTSGAMIPFTHVVAAAARDRVSVRGGCFCNPGCAEAAFGFDADHARACRTSSDASYTHEQFAACMDCTVGAVRASIGIPTVQSDIDRLMRALMRYRGLRVTQQG